MSNLETVSINQEEGVTTLSYGEILIKLPTYVYESMVKVSPSFEDFLELCKTKGSITPTLYPY